jgi:hypothetical protein
MQLPSKKGQTIPLPSKKGQTIQLPSKKGQTIHYQVKKDKQYNYQTKKDKQYNVSQSLYTLALLFLLGLAVVTKSAVGSAGTNPSTT